MSEPAPPPPAPPAPPPTPPPAPPPVWHEGKATPEIVGLWQNKGWKADDPAAIAIEATKAYSEAQRFIGAPADQLLRIPSPSAPEADLKAFWARLGAPAEAKDIDLSTIKTAAGQPIDAKLAETIAATAVSARAPKDAALAIAGAVVKHLDGIEAEATAIKSGAIAQESATLKANWGANYDANLIVAKNALTRVAQAAGLPADKAKAAADTLSTLGGIGAAAAMEMWRVIGTKIGEDKFVQVGAGGSNLPMTREAAKAEIKALKGDPAFSKRLLEGGAVERQRWDALHKIGFAEAAA